ncbi:MAG: hypothetical protein ACI9K2_002435 [Myxococcota bacterium]
MLWLRVAVASTLVGCSMVFGTPITDQTVPAACGLCIYGQPSQFGCYWAIEWDGAYYPVNGQTPSDEEHEAHGAEGMCTVSRQARVSGTLRKGKFLADSFELLPFDPTAPRPDAPAHEHEH